MKRRYSTLQVIEATSKSIRNGPIEHRRAVQTEKELREFKSSGK